MAFSVRLASGWLALLLLLTGCATPPRPAPASPEAAARTWSGRMALSVQGQPGQSFSGGFELQGEPQAGQLALFTPLGGTLAVLQWSPGSAVLRSGDKVRQFESIDALVTEAAGAAIPVAALFDWLRGTDTPVAGWQADLSDVANGRIRAQRTSPPPPADLRVAFDR